ncbi:hypothetical protein [Candidatus Mycoplasma haematominutum]|uniref:hypothetical protein n=1 Tax=Candidatus Mycoplasma haematominutum TaxID=209446 RepID=UPI0011B67B78|nr:hypothetical protein [Candidatus Mycoplasma haematominutum]
MIPETHGMTHREWTDLASKAQLEIDSIEYLENGDSIFRFKPICDFRCISGWWILVKELRLSCDRKVCTNLNKKQLNFFPSNSPDFERLVKDLFGNELDTPLSQFLIRDFGSEYPQVKSYLEKFLVSSHNFKLTRPRSICKLTELLPIFESLKNNWENKVIAPLQQNNWEFIQSGDNIWTIVWPPWYFQDTLPPFSEILGRLLPLDQGPKPIRENKKFESQNINQNFGWSAMRNYLIERGFIECNTSKFVETARNLNSSKYCLSYNKKLTLRDNLHYSLVFEVLLKNLNSNKKLFPIFEFSYCPWNNCWILGLSSPIELKGKRESGNFWYSVAELKELLVDFFKKLFHQNLEFASPDRGVAFPLLCGALIYRLVVNEKEAGQMMIHRLEQFEIRRQEVVSVNVKIPHFR